METLGGTITSSSTLIILFSTLSTTSRGDWAISYVQSMGVVTPFLSPICSESTTRRTSAELRPVEAGYCMVKRIFFLGSIMNTERMVNAIPIYHQLSLNHFMMALMSVGIPCSSIFCKSCASTISYNQATFLAASAIIGKP